MNRNVLEIIFFFSLLGASGLVLFFIFQPYLGALFVALVFSIAFYPVHLFFLKHTKERRSISALLSVLVVLVIILLPLFVIGAVLFQETKDIAVELQNGNGVLPFLETKLDTVEARLNALAPDAHIELDLRAIAGNTISWISDHIGAVFTGVAKGALDLFIMIVGLFFFLRDGSRIREILISWSPLRDDHDKAILDKITVAVNSVLKGSLLIAVVQGFLTGVGFAIFGVPSPVLWGFVATLASLIPSVGTAIVWIPGVVFLFALQNDTVMAIGLAAWGIFLVGLIDNVLRPVLIERGVKIHPFLILLSVFGGIGLFGPIGFLVGPIVLSFVFALIEVSPKIIRNGTE